MGRNLDLDDVAATSPSAKEELDELRAWIFSIESLLVDMKSYLIAGQLLVSRYEGLLKLREAWQDKKGPMNE